MAWATKSSEVWRLRSGAPTSSTTSPPGAVNSIGSES